MFGELVLPEISKRTYTAVSRSEENSVGIVLVPWQPDTITRAKSSEETRVVRAIFIFILLPSQSLLAQGAALGEVRPIAEHLKGSEVHGKFENEESKRYYPVNEGVLSLSVGE